ncbi:MULTISPECIES: PLD nuclease N-terminal domain-containing protein [unclassified Microbacterium]|uniref:PLD nuclease N-terminal domain-containing protein n=1 Tax=Microbacterium TaxID=33882 RepID=UPI003BA1DD35
MLFSLLVLAFSVVTLIDIITREEGQVKHLPKFGWVIIAILIPLLGGALWWAIGREYPERVARPVLFTRPAAEQPQAAPARPVDTRTTEQQLADLEREAEEERLRAEILRRKRERGEA